MAKLERMKLDPEVRFTPKEERVNEQELMLLVEKAKRSCQNNLEMPFLEISPKVKKEQLPLSPE